MPSTTKSKTRSGNKRNNSPPASTAMTTRAGRKRAISTVDDEAAKPKKKKKTDQEATEKENEKGKKGNRKEPKPKKGKKMRKTSTMRAAEDMAAPEPSHLSKSEAILESSGITIAPPKRAKIAGAAMAPLATQSTSRQRRKTEPEPRYEDNAGNDDESIGSDDESIGSDDEADTSTNSTNSTNSTTSTDDDDDDKDSNIGNDIDMDDDHNGNKGNENNDNNDSGQPKPTTTAPTVPVPVPATAPAAISTAATSAGKPAEAATCSTTAISTATSARKPVEAATVTTAASLNTPTPGTAAIATRNTTTSARKPTDATTLTTVASLNTPTPGTAANATRSATIATTATTVTTTSTPTTSHGNTAAETTTGPHDNKSGISVDFDIVMTDSNNISVDDDPFVASPPQSPLLLRGSSRTTGGILRGNALGNVYNFGDRMDIDSPPGKVEGKVHVYTTHGNPENFKPYMVLKHEVTNHLMPIIKALGNVYSPVKKQNQRVFVYEDELWNVRGRYKAVIEKDGEVDWTVLNQQFTLKLLITADDGPKLASTASTLTSDSVPPPSLPSLPTSESIPSFKQELITHLGIPISLTGTGDVSLQLAYQKYQAFLTAFRTYEEMVKANTWDIPRPTKTNIIELFVSKSFYHSHYKRYFSKVAGHDEMVSWLNENEDRMCDVDLWGVKKEVYNFTDLAAWLLNGGTLEVGSDGDYIDIKDKGTKGKGLRKENLKVREKRKEKGKEREQEKEKRKEKLTRSHKKEKNRGGKNVEVFYTISSALISAIALGLSSPILLYVMGMAMIPITGASSVESPFPDIPFKLFSHFITENFSSKLSLSAALVILFSLTENPDLLNLHARQQYVKCQGEHRAQASGWIKALARALIQQIDDQQVTRLKMKNVEKGLDKEEEVVALGLKLDSLSKLLHLHPYNSDEQFQGKLRSISNKSIQPALVICPNIMECQTLACKLHSLHQITPIRDIPHVTLIKESIIYENVPVLTGQCVGRALWVDRPFSQAVLNGIYNFHASAAAYTEYWNNSFRKNQIVQFKKITRRQVWQAFVQESIRLIASASDTDLVIQDGLSIDEVTKEAFEVLGANGVIRVTGEHSCSECAQEYKATADVIPSSNSAATIEADVESSSDNNDEQMQVDKTFVQLVVLDGIVTGPSFCAYDNCTSELANARGGVFCALHQMEYGTKCRVVGCSNQKIAGIQTCEQHRADWTRFYTSSSRQKLSGFRRMLRRSGETLPWESASVPNPQRHDEDMPEIQRSNYFTARRFYCVETICAPCGVVIAWAKFAKSESPENILHFLQTVYPTEDSRPAYICIDKACLVLRHSIANGTWDMWKKTSRLIVDSYHYTNHSTTDFLCRKWCNPAPMDGSAPNLVIVESDADGVPHYKRAFNTQACEQLNAWLGGFDSILRKMTVGNFNWFLHVMLSYHSLMVMEKQQQKTGGNNSDGDSDSEDTSDID